MTKEQERAELLAVARELITTMRAFIEPVNKITCKLDYEASRLLPQVFDEREAAGKDVLGEDNGSALKKHRGCGICGKPGHRRTTCPHREDK